MKTLLILPLLLGSIAAFTQSEIHFLNCDETNENCELNLSEVEELQLKHYNKARIFFFKNTENGQSNELAVVDDRLNFQVPNETKLVLVKLANENGLDHLWLHLPNNAAQLSNESNLIRAQLFAGAYHEVTEIEPDFEQANKYFDIYLAESNSQDENLFTPHYWHAQVSKNKEAALAQMVARSRVTTNPDEMNLLIKEMSDLGDTLYSQQLTSKLLENFPQHPISIEMNTWDLRRQSYLAKNGSINYNLYKEYLKQTASYRGIKAQQRIENHKAQFLVNLYQHYWDMQYDWYKEVAQLSPTNQVYVFSITGRGLMESSVLEAYDLVDRALEISIETLVNDVQKEINTSILTTSEIHNEAEKCKDLAFYLKGKLWQSENEDEKALLAFEKAVTLNEYIIDDYNVAYAQALQKAERWDDLAIFLDKVSETYPLSPILQKIASTKPKKAFESQTVNTPVLSFTDEKGQIFELGNSTLELLDIWNSDCEACMKNFPDMYFLQRTYATDLSILSVATDDAKLAHSTLANRGFDTFETLAPNLLQSLYKTYNFEGNQAKILLNKEGKVLYQKNGNFTPSDLKELQAIVEAYVKNTPSR